MRAIMTKFMDASRSKPVQVKAFDSVGNSVIIPYDHTLDGQAPYLKAAKALCAKLDWPDALVGAPMGQGYVFVPDAYIKLAEAHRSIIEWCEPERLEIPTNFKDCCDWFIRRLMLIKNTSHAALESLK